MSRTPLVVRLSVPALTGLVLFAAGLSACSQKEPMEADEAYGGDRVEVEDERSSSSSVATRTEQSGEGDATVATGSTAGSTSANTSSPVSADPAPPADPVAQPLGEAPEAEPDDFAYGVDEDTEALQAVSPAGSASGRSRPSKPRADNKLAKEEGEKAGSGGAVAGPLGGAVLAQDSRDKNKDLADRSTRRQTAQQEQKPASAPATGAAGQGLLGTEIAAAPPVDTPVVPDVVRNSERFTDYGVNPFTMVSQDHLSTFSIDVDTASYSIARRKLEEGSLPPEAAVRVEEFINYFDFAYPQPTGDVPFNVAMEAMPDPFRSGHHILRVGVQGKEVSRDERPPVHLTFLVDVSGSMSSSDKLPLAKKSLHMLVDSLREDDTVALAVYAGRTARVLEPTSAANKRAIHDAIEDLKSGGSTAMSSGIDLAYEMAWQAFEPGAENRVIVLSDGDANVGRTSWDEMLSQIKGYADKGVTVSTIGFGMGNYQDTLMEQLSNNGDGNNYYIDDAEQAQRVFVEELGGTLVTIARDVKLQVDFNEESVLAYRLLGYENRDVADKDFRNDKVDAGEIGSGHNVTALYEVILKDGYTRELATVRVRWEAPGADVDQGGSGGMERAYTFRDRDLKETPYLAGRDTRIAYAAATFAEILRGSPHTQEIDLAALARFTQQSARKGETDDVELVGLMKAADQLGADGAFLADN